MITEKDLQEQIAKYQGKIDITSDECVKLSAFYILKKELYPDDDVNIPQYSYAATPEQTTYNSGTEFSDAIQGMDISDVMAVFDDLMEATYVYNKSLYNATIRELKKH